MTDNADDDDGTAERGDYTAAREDAMDRFERVLDLQAVLLNEIDTKAEHITRLVALLLGVILTALSISFRFGGELPEATLPTIIAFGMDITGLVVAMAAAIVTYLSSKFKLGIHPDASYTLEEARPDWSTYTILVVNSYASAIERNYDVIEVNSARFRLTLTALLIGIGSFALSIFQYAALRTAASKWAALGVGTLLLGLAVVYILTGSYLTLNDQEERET